MSIAIIAEYNPFHNGHIYQLRKTKELFPNEKIIVILSGRYVQRGEIAVATFLERKKIALKYGADEVIELPFEYATQAAHIFANGAVSIINKMNIKKIIFGSESNDVSMLVNTAKIIYDNETEYNKVLKMNLKTGLSFPKSANNALKFLSGQDISLPNDILGFEYVKSIIRNNFNITPYSIKRTVQYKSDITNYKNDIYYTSASHIRQLIKDNEDISKFSPMIIDSSSVEYIEDKYSEFQEIVNNLSNEELKNIKLISEGMENLFKKHIHEKDYDSFVSKCNSKRYTSSRIKRVMLYVLLKIN